MKKIIVILVILMLVVGCRSSSKNEPVGFSTAKWGDSMKQVKESESDHVPLSVPHDADYLAYDYKILGSNVGVMYMFTEEDELYFIRYNLTDLDYNQISSVYISEYDKFKEAIIEKYNNPLRDVISEKDDLEYLTRWETSTTIVSQQMDISTTIGGFANAKIEIYFISKTINSSLNN